MPTVTSAPAGQQPSAQPFRFTGQLYDGGTGEPAKVALTACMRKLPVILNAMVRSGTPWEDRLQAA